MCSEDPYQHQRSFEGERDLHLEWLDLMTPKCFYEGEKCPNCSVGELELMEDEVLGDKFVCTICRHSVKR